MSILIAMKNWTVARIPELWCGPGSFDRLIDQIGTMAHGHLAIITGKSSFRSTKAFGRLLDTARAAGRVSDFSVEGEPSPEIIDGITTELRAHPPGIVLAVGGGSVMDAGKAVAAMIPTGGSVMEYLEGVGSKKPSGLTTGCIAVPTTSGTGSEATKNAVISRSGRGGFKKSLRHEHYIPVIAVLDPGLSVQCPPAVTASSGLDAVTQLLEAYVSTAANPITDIFADDGLKRAGKSLSNAVVNGLDEEARLDMSLSAFYSGIALANAGLGIIHGLASPIGGAFTIPHGVVCGTLSAGISRAVIEKLKGRMAQDATNAAAKEALEKYARAGVALSGRDAGSVDANCISLIDTLDRWIGAFGIPRFGRYGIKDDDLRVFSEEAGMKNSPVPLTPGEILEVLRDRL